jgi:hypothetical protein
MIRDQSRWIRFPGSAFRGEAQHPDGVIVKTNEPVRGPFFEVERYFTDLLYITSLEAPDWHSVRLLAERISDEVIRLTDTIWDNPGPALRVISTALECCIAATALADGIEECPETSTTLDALPQKIQTALHWIRVTSYGAHYDR